MVQNPWGEDWGRREGLPPGSDADAVPDLNHYGEPPGGDYVRYVERLLAGAERRRRTAAATAAAMVPGPAAASRGARGRASQPAVATPVATRQASRPAPEAVPSGMGGAAVWRRLAAAPAWRAGLVLAWLVVVVLAFLAPALLPLLAGLALGLGLVGRLWKKLRP